jgi:hypothetical protein
VTRAPEGSLAGVNRATKYCSPPLRKRPTTEPCPSRKSFEAPPRRNTPPRPRDMSKRPAEASDQELEAIKNGDRPMEIDPDEAGEFEDEFEDEFESEDEILEAGVDGRPDEEREAEERERMHGGQLLPLHTC